MESGGEGGTATTSSSSSSRQTPGEEALTNQQQQQQIFGVSLEEVMTRPGERRIPTALKKLFLFLNGAIEVENLFRAPADPSEVALIIGACDSGQARKVLVAGSSNNVNVTRVHAAGAAVKEYLRVLPEPLLTWDLYSAFIAAASLPTSSSSSFFTPSSTTIPASSSTTTATRQETLSTLLLEQLPAPNRALAQVLFLYLARVADHAHRNRMDSLSLATIFGPLVLRPRHDDELSSTAETTTTNIVLHGPHITSVVKYIIDSYDLLFSSSSSSSLAKGQPTSSPSSTQQHHQEEGEGVQGEQQREGNFSGGVLGEIAGEKFHSIVDAIDQSIALVQSKLVALHKQLEATDSMEEAIQIAKKIRTAKRILFHDDLNKPNTPEQAVENNEAGAAGTQDPKQPSPRAATTGQLLETDGQTPAAATVVAAASSTTTATATGSSSRSSSRNTSPRTGEPATAPGGAAVNAASVNGSGSGGSGGLESTGLGLESGYESQQGVRKTMEDAHVLIDDLLPAFPELATAGFATPLAFYAVYDGHSGTEAALEAAEVVHPEVIKQPGFVEGRVEEALQEGFRRADAHILEKSARDGWKNGTTAVSAFILARTIYVANAGDSEAIMGQRLPDGSYRAAVLSHKHKPTDKDEKERIRAAGGHVVFGRLFGDLAVSRSLGDPDYKKPLSEANYISSEPHVSTTELQTDKDEFLIIGCDGVWDVINYQEAMEVVSTARQSGQTASGAAQVLVKRALEKGSKDNVTVVIVYFNWPSTTSTSDSATTS